jgi:hypothetical protein
MRGQEDCLKEINNVYPFGRHKYLWYKFHRFSGGPVRHFDPFDYVPMAQAPKAQAQGRLFYSVQALLRMKGRGLED